MATSRICLLIGLLCACLFNTSHLVAQTAANPFGQTLEINTSLTSIVGKPSWLIIVRNMETGQVLPHVFDFKNENNFWLVLTFSRFYRVTVSNLQFDNKTIIPNFCNLVGGVLSQASMHISLSGVLSPKPNSYRCITSLFKPYSFTIVVNDDD